MKRILLRFESKSGTILWLSVVAIVFGFVSGIAFFDGIIAVGCIFAIICAGLIAALLYFAFRKEVIIDFKHNLFKMKAGIKKEQCALDQVKNLEIVFRWVKKNGLLFSSNSCLFERREDNFCKNIPENL